MIRFLILLAFLLPLVGRGADGYIFNSGGTTTTAASAGTNTVTSVLSSAVSAGANSIVVTAVPSNAAARLVFVVIDKYSLNCEIRGVASISGTTVNIGTESGATFSLLYDHPANTPVEFITGNLSIPITWFGAKPGINTDVQMTNNVSAMNRLTTNIWHLGTQRAANGIFVPSGIFYLNSTFWHEQNIPLRGVSPNNSSLTAGGTFTFNSTGEVAIIHCMREGLPTTFNLGGASARWFINDLGINGANIANSCGILSGPQQPDSWENLRIDNCLYYGIGLSDVQQHVMNNIEIQDCGIGIWGKGVRFLWLDGINNEGAIISEMKFDTQIDGGSECFANSFYNGHSEGFLGTNQFDLNGVGWIFDNFYSSNYDSNQVMFKFQSVTSDTLAQVYQLRNIRANQPSTLFKMVDDVDRNFTITSEQAKRHIVYLVGQAHNNSVALHGIRIPGINGDDLRLGAPSLTGAAQVRSKVGTAGGVHFSMLDVNDTEVSITIGTGSPSHSRPNGSIHFGTNGSMWLRTNATWVIK